MEKEKMFFNLFLLVFFPCFTTFPMANGNSNEIGKILFENNCVVCHKGGNNVIIPEKNLKKDALEENGMNTVNAISYQILNGKNGMPAFGGRLKEPEIEAIAKYVVDKSQTNFEE